MAIPMTYKENVIEYLKLGDYRDLQNSINRDGKFTSREGKIIKTVDEYVLEKVKWLCKQV